MLGEFLQWFMPYVSGWLGASGNQKHGEGMAASSTRVPLELPSTATLQSRKGDSQQQTRSIAPNGFCPPQLSFQRSSLSLCSRPLQQTAAATNPEHVAGPLRQSSLEATTFPIGHNQSPQAPFWRSCSSPCKRPPLTSFRLSQHTLRSLELGDQACPLYDPFLGVSTLAQMRAVADLCCSSVRGLVPHDFTDSQDGRAIARMWNKPLVAGVYRPSDYEECSFSKLSPI